MRRLASAGKAAVMTSLLVSVGACRPGVDRAEKKPTQSTPASASATASTAAPTSATAATPEDDVRRVVKSWNGALDAHDVDALLPLYGRRVHFYTKDLAKADVIALKRRALGTQRGFRQQLLGAIAVSTNADGTYGAFFTKRSGSAGATKDIDAVLTCERQADGTMVIVGESDVVSRARDEHGPGADCEATLSRVVNALPAVKRAVLDAQRVADQSHGRTSFGGLDPQPDDEVRTWSLGLHSEERFEPYVLYSVNRGGALTVTVQGEDLVVPPPALEEVHRACAASQ